ncbi:MAG: Asp-tRNA(Asn)/Glu-tRNA(Gln) amidotransferase GatCAB subunit C, partial [Eubacteriales bacterium]|nr:Asp-tRNA(Asn)/Glu-tRNA(Gln) amidotransferase GatCAB subunit C [Eubacteriales bacterium]
DLDLMQDDATKPLVRSQAYDVVLNGIELGSGSVRIHRPDVQSRVFSALGFSKQEAQERFGFMLGAFRYGTPPHAGFAFGLDRLCMQLLGESSLREVIAFPKVKDASCPMTGAPDYVDHKQLEDLKLGVSAAETGREEHIRRMQRETVKNTALLSMLDLPAQDEQKLDGEFASIVDFAGQLALLDREAPREKRADGASALRPDQARPGLTAAEVLMNAKTVSGPYITVPKSFE